MLQTNILPEKPARILVGLSGGADSVALLLLLREAGYEVEAAHCNFQLRGEESERDEQFVVRLCEQKQVRLHRIRFDTQQEAHRRGVSIEMAARDLRYTWFEALRQERGAAAIAVAHHQDDANETLLLNLVRGCGIHGLTGMPAVNGHIVRPLLGATRAEILRYLAERGQAYVTDSTNAETLYKRNLVRHELLPLLERLNPSIRETLTAMRQRMAETTALYDKALAAEAAALFRPQANGGDIAIAALLHSCAPQSILTHLLGRYGFTPAQSAMIFGQLDSRTGACFDSPTHWAAIHRGQLEVRKRWPRIAPTPQPCPGTWQDADRCLRIAQGPAGPLSAIPRQPHVACLDADRTNGPIYIRSVEAGDRFTPLGMKGSKLVSDFLTNAHCSVIDKRHALVVCDDSGILWLVGHRPDQRAACTAATQTWLLLETYSFVSSSRVAP